MTAMRGEGRNRCVPVWFLPWARTAGSFAKAQAHIGMTSIRISLRALCPKTFSRLVSLLLFPAVGACSSAPATSFGDAHAGAVAISREACGSCHRIPGIDGANGMVGPSLAGFASRQMIVGLFANSPANLHHYLKNPAIAGPGNVMPVQGLSDREVSDIAAYLYTLR
jgi:cytochrome c2